MRDSPDFTDGFGRSLVNFGEMGSERDGLGGVLEGEEGSIFDHEQALSEAVVEFTGDPFSFGFLGLEHSAREFDLGGLLSFEMIDAVVMEGEGQDEGGGDRSEDGG